MDKFKGIMEIINLAEKLKMELRHSWLSNGRQESVAEHTWRMSLMAILVEPYLENKIDMTKLLKMIIIHDLVEAEAGDIPAFDTINDPSLKEQKRQREIEAIHNIRKTLPEELGVHLYHLWMEFEDKETYEAKVANALDKLEVQIQHNEADISTWLDIEHEMTYKLQRHVSFDRFLLSLQELVQAEGENKMIASGINVNNFK
ncbi:HD domain-containing protein [Microbacteriaceae bacterium 4G12]